MWILMELENNIRTHIATHFSVSSKFDFLLIGHRAAIACIMNPLRVWRVGKIMEHRNKYVNKIMHGC